MEQINKQSNYCAGTAVDRRPSTKIYSKLFLYLKQSGNAHLYSLTKSIIKEFPLSEQLRILDVCADRTQSLGDRINDLLTRSKLDKLYGTISQYNPVAGVKDSLDTLHATAKLLKEKMPHYFERIESTLKTFEMFSDTRTFIMFLLDCITFFLCLYYDVPAIVTISAGAKLLLKILTPNAKALVDKCISYFMKVFSKSNIPDVVLEPLNAPMVDLPQSKTNVVSGFVEFIRSLIGLQSVDDRDCVTIFQKMRSQFGLLKDMKNVWNVIVSVVNSIKIYFRPDLYADRTEDILTEWENFSIELNKPDFEKRFGTDPDFAHKLRTKFEQIVHMRRLFMDASPAIRDRYKMVSHTYSLAMTLIGSLENSFVNRIKPVVVHFYGESGTGKSTLVGYLADELHRLLQNEPNDKILSPNQVMYSVNIEDKFRDSYNCQTVWYYDDPNQNKDVDVLMNFMTELIQVGNDVPYKLNCSDLSGKAGTYFASPFAMFTTNGSLEETLNIVKDKLQSREAVKRRIQFEVRVEVDKDKTLKDRYILHVKQGESEITCRYKGFLQMLLKAYAHNYQEKKNLKSANGTTEDMRQFLEEMLPAKDRLDKTEGKMSYLANRMYGYFNPQIHIDVRNKWLQEWHRITCPIIATDKSPYYDEWLLLNRSTTLFTFAETADYYNWKVSVLPPGKYRVGNTFQDRAYHSVTIDLPDQWRQDYPPLPSTHTWYVYESSDTLEVGNELLKHFCHNGHVWIKPTDEVIVNTLIDENYGKMITQVEKIRVETALALLSHRIARTSVAVVNSQPFQVFLTTFCDTMAILASFLIAFSTTSLVVGFFLKAYSKPSVEVKEYDPQVDYPKDFSNVKNAHVRVPPIRKMKQDVVQGESEISLITSNVRHLSWSYTLTDEVTSSLKGIFLKEGYLLFPKHFFHFRKNEPNLRIIRYQDTRGVLIPFEYLMTNAVCIEDEDLVLVDCGKFMQGKDITRHMLSDKELSTLHSERLELRVPRFNKEPKEIIAKANFYYVPHKYRSPDNVEFQVSNHFRFEAETENGYCGSPYFMTTNRFRGSFVGIHVAGNGYTGVGTMFSREMFYKCVSLMATTTQASASNILKSDPCDKPVPYTVPSKLTFIKRVQPQDGVFMPSKTNIEKNVEWFGFLNDLFDVGDDRQPAMMKKTYVSGVLVDPMQNALAKIGEKNPPILKDDLIIYEDVCSKLVKLWPSGSRLEPMTESEILNGIPGTQFKGINMKHSAGINYLGAKLPGKFTYVICDICSLSEKCSCVNRIWKLTLEARSHMADLEKKILTEDIVTVFQACFKDELRPYEKAVGGKTRLFSVGSFELQYFVRKYFGHFMERFTSEPILFGTGIGINPHSIDWKNLYDHLNVFKRSIEADAQSWDFNICWDLLGPVINMYRQWYRKIYNDRIARGYPYDEDDFKRDDLFREKLGVMMHKGHLIIGDLLFSAEFVFSGHPMTGITNTVVNNVATRAAFIIHYSGNLKFPELNDRMRMTATGDDVVITHSFEDYTCDQHAAAMKRLGITLTPATKTGAFKEFYELTEVVYLKRRFVPKDGLVFAPLDKVSVFGAINWKHKGMSCQAAARANILTTLIECMHYGPEIYEDARMALVDKYCDLYKDMPGAYLNTCTYQEMVFKMQEGCLNVDYTQSGKESIQRDKQKSFNKVKQKYSKMAGPSSEALKRKTGPNNKPGMENLRRIVTPEGKQYIVTRDRKTNKEVLIFERDVPKPHEPKPVTKSSLPKVLAKEKSKEDPSKLSDKDLVDEMFGENKEVPHPFLKDEKVSEPKHKSSKNEEDDLEFVVQKLNSVRIQDPSQGIIACPDLEEEECDTLDEIRHPARSEEISAKVSNPNMTKSIRKLTTSNGSLSTKSVDFKKNPLPKQALKSNLKRTHRPSVPGDKQATTLIRYLGITYETLLSMKEKYRMHRYRSDLAFTNTRLHFSEQNLRKICKANALVFEEESRQVPETLIAGLEIIVREIESGEIIATATAFDMDPKNTRKFAYWNAIIEISMLDIDVGYFAQASNTSEVVPVASPMTMTSANTAVVEEMPDVVSSSAQKPLDLIRQFDPYNDMTPHLLLERQLLLFTTPITSAQSRFAAVVQMNVPGTFTNVPEWRELLTRFSRCIFDVEIEARINSNMMQQGLLLWSYNPGIKPAYGRFASPFSAPLMVLQDITTSPTIRFTVPGFSYKTGFYTRATSGADDENYLGGVITCTLLSQIRESNSTAPISVLLTIYAKLTNVRTLGFRTQSGKELLPKENMIKSLPPVSHTTENINKAKNGISTAFDTVSDVAGVVSVVPQFAPMASSISAISKLASTVTRYFGYSNSRDMSSNAPVYPRSVPTLSLNHGLFQTDVHALSVDSQVTTDSIVLGDQVDYNLYDNFKLRPGLVSFFSVTSGTSVGPVLTIPVGPQFAFFTTDSDRKHRAPVAILAEMHNFWRGGMKYKFVAVCNRFVSCRVRIYWKPSDAIGVTPTTTGVSNFANRIVNISGPTVFEFTIPFLGDYPALTTGLSSNAPDANGALVVELLTPVQVQGTVAVPIDFLVFAAGAEDLIFAKPKTIDIDFVQSGMEGNDICASFRTIFEPIVDAKTCLHDKITFSDVCSSFTERWSKPFFYKTITVTPTLQGSNPSPSRLDLADIYAFTISANKELHLMTSLFTAHRGSLNLIFMPRTVQNFRFAARSLVGNADLVNRSVPYCQEPTSYGDHLNKQAISMTLPYFSSAYYIQPGFPASWNLWRAIDLYCFSDSSVTPVVVDVLIALGDDYTLGHSSSMPYEQIA